MKILVEFDLLGGHQQVHISGLGERCSPTMQDTFVVVDGGHFTNLL